MTIDNQEFRGQETIAREGKENEAMKEYWILHFDGASKTKSSGTGIVLQSPDGFMIEYALKMDFPITNN